MSVHTRKINIVTVEVVTKKHLYITRDLQNFITKKLRLFTRCHQNISDDVQQYYIVIVIIEGSILI